MNNDPSLDVVGFIEGTSKSSIWVDFLRHYERHFTEFKQKNIQLLEIGVFDGSSLTLWKDYFPNATIIGVDINPQCKQHEEGRAIVEIGSQDDPEFLAILSRRYSPTIIIDDGSHLAHHVIFTFERLFPYLLPGGLYIIEDMFLHVGPFAEHYCSTAKTSVPEYLFELSRMLVREGIDPTKNHGNLASFRKQIDEIAFVPNGAALIRKKGGEDANCLTSQAEVYAQRTGKASHWLRAADFIQRKKGPLERAEAAVRRAIELEPISWQAYVALSQIENRGGYTEGAIRSATKATELAHDNPSTWYNLGQLLLEQQDFAASSGAFHKSLAVSDKHFPSYEGLSRALERGQNIGDAQAVLNRGLAAKPPPNWTASFKKALAELERKQVGG
jgi:tetratricopeptide (TPR) repeat protein